MENVDKVSFIIHTHCSSRRSCMTFDPYSGKTVPYSLHLVQVGTTETLEAQYEIVKKETTTSHVMQYGDMVHYAHRQEMGGVERGCRAVYRYTCTYTC